MELQQLLVPGSTSSSWGKPFRLQRAGVRGKGWLSRENACFGGSGRHSAMDVQQLLEKAPAESRVVLGRGRMPGALLVPEGKGTLPGHWSEFLEVIKNAVFYAQNEGRSGVGVTLKQRLRKNLLGEGMKEVGGDKLLLKIKGDPWQNNCELLIRKLVRTVCPPVELCGMS